MKFAVILPFVVGALAVTRRQAADIPAALDAITAATTNAGNAIQAFTGDTSDVASTSAGVIAAISAADAVVGRSGNLTPNEVVALLDPTNRLNAAVKTAIDNTIAQHDALVTACYGLNILQALQQQQKASAALVDDIAAKSGSLSEAAKSGGAPAAADLQRGIDAFADAKACEATTSAAAPESTTAAAEASTAPATTEAVEGTSTAMASVYQSAYPSESVEGTSTAMAPVYQSAYPSESTEHATSSKAVHSAPPAYSTHSAAPPAYSTHSAAPVESKPVRSSAPGAAKPTGYKPVNGTSTKPSSSPTPEPYMGAAGRTSIISFCAVFVGVVGIAAF